MWPVNIPLRTKLYGCKQELEKTTSFICRPALIVQSANTKKKEKIAEGPTGERDRASAGS